MTVENEFSFLDRPEILQYLFHPRKPSGRSNPDWIREVEIETSDGVSIGCRLHLTEKHLPHILFFHGNGEISHDYDSIGPVYNQFGLNFMVADYRGYGISTGEPTVSAMLEDAHVILDALTEWLKKEGHSGPLWLMGRSLGSAPAIELAVRRSDKVSGLIVESGFADTLALIHRLGIPVDSEGLKREHLFSNADKIKNYTGPVLVIHAECDQIIPVDHGRTLYKKASGAGKELKIIPGADHNDIFSVAAESYFQYIRKFIYGSEKMDASDTART